MDEAEKDRFRKEIKGNNKLKKEFEFRLKTDEILKKQDVLNLRHKWRSITGSRDTPIVEHRNPWHATLKYAAAAVVLIAVAGISLLSRRDGKNAIIEKYYKAYEATSSLRSARAPENTDFRTALEYYDNHDYKNAAVYFDSVLEKTPGDMQSALLKGISDFETGNFPESEKSFIKVINDNNNLYIDHARWYLSLCYIKNDDRTKAAEELTLIKKSKSLYSRDAGKILKSLK
jgi:TolA-binding protein